MWCFLSVSPAMALRGLWVTDTMERGRIREMASHFIEQFVFEILAGLRCCDFFCRPESCHLESARDLTFLSSLFIESLAGQVKAFTTRGHKARLNDCTVSAHRWEIQLTNYQMHYWKLGSSMNRWMDLWNKLMQKLNSYLEVSDSYVGVQVIKYETVFNLQNHIN